MVVSQDGDVATLVGDVGGKLSASGSRRARLEIGEVVSQDGDVATSVGDAGGIPCAILKASHSRMARLVGGEEKPGLIAACAGKSWNKPGCTTYHLPRHDRLFEVST
jgi:hypothetical protein